jgi:membrane-associated HD superfamily phosphohydrolase
MTFRQQIEESSQYDYQFQVDNLPKQNIVNSYEEQLNKTLRLQAKCEELEKENIKLKQLEQIQGTMDNLDTKFNDIKEYQIALAYMFGNFESNIEQQETIINGNYKFTINRK